MQQFNFSAHCIPRVLRIEELQQLKNKLLIDHFLPCKRTWVSTCTTTVHIQTYRGLEIWGLEEPEEELIHKSEVRPRCLEGWVVLLRVKVRVVTGRQRSEQVARDLSNVYQIQILILMSGYDLRPDVKP